MCILRPKNAESELQVDDRVLFAVEVAKNDNVVAKFVRSVK